MSLRLKFILILVLAVATVLVAMPHDNAILKVFGFNPVGQLSVKQGLDLQGGAQPFSG